MAQLTVTPQTIVCPHCNQTFEYSKVNGIAMIEIMGTVEAKKQMHCRLTLNNLERVFGDSPQWPLIRKAIFDGYNDLARDVHAILGFGPSEVE